MSNYTAHRLCSECLTTDASFPLIPNCQSCKEMLAHDEYVFWNSPLYWEEETDAQGKKIHSSVLPKQFMRRVRQPWRALFDLLMMT